MSRQYPGSCLALLDKNKRGTEVIDSLYYQRRSDSVTIVSSADQRGCDIGAVELRDVIFANGFLGELVQWGRRTDYHPPIACASLSRSPSAAVLLRLRPSRSTVSTTTRPLPPATCAARSPRSTQP